MSKDIFQTQMIEDTIVLKKCKVVAQKYFDRETCSQLHLDIRRADFVDSLIATLWGYFDKEELDKQDVRFEYWRYESWWDHFKERFFPKWLKKRFPPQKKWDYAVEQVTHCAVFPKATNMKGYERFIRIVEPQIFPNYEREYED